MQVYWTLTRRELAGYFVSLTGYVIIGVATFFDGFDAPLVSRRRFAADGEPVEADHRHWRQGPHSAGRRIARRRRRAARW